MQVEAGQELAEIDPTRFEAQQAEGETKRIALKASIARLTAEATGRALVFPPEVLAGRVRRQWRGGVVRRAQARARRRRGVQPARHRPAAARAQRCRRQMSAKGLLSEVEVLHLRRQVNEMALQSEDRINRFRQDASSRADQAADRSRADRGAAGRARGRVAPHGDQVAGARAGQEHPHQHARRRHRAGRADHGDRAASASARSIEARVKPGEIGFLQVGQTAQGQADVLRRDDLRRARRRDRDRSARTAIGDPDRASGSSDPTYYRVMLRVDNNTLHEKGKPLPMLPGMTGSGGSAHRRTLGAQLPAAPDAQVQGSVPRALNRRPPAATPGELSRESPRFPSFARDRSAVYWRPAARVFVAAMQGAAPHGTHEPFRLDRRRDAGHGPRNRRVGVRHADAPRRADAAGGVRRQAHHRRPLRRRRERRPGVGTGHPHRAGGGLLVAAGRRRRAPEPA